MPTRVLLLGTGLIGTSFGLALKGLGSAFDGTLLGWDANPAELAAAHRMGAIDELLPDRKTVLTPGLADVYVLATPVLPILDWLVQLAPVLSSTQLVTDVGSTKRMLVERVAPLYNGPGQAAYLPGHPMTGKESGGAALAEAALFRGAAWLFTPAATAMERRVAHPLESLFLGWIQGIGAEARFLDPGQHDLLCAWVSHLPQMLSTALASVLEETFANDPEGRELIHAIGGRALRETTRLGASPYSMWRDIALTNTEPLAATIYALEQQLAHVRANLRTPELREIFASAQRLRSPK